MNLLTTIIAFLMLADSAFTLANLKKVESWLEELFPNLDIRKLAIIEGAVGLLIILFKLATTSLT